MSPSVQLIGPAKSSKCKGLIIYQSFNQYILFRQKTEILPLYDTEHDPVWLYWHCKRLLSFP